MAGPVQRFGDVFPLPGFGPPKSPSHALGRALLQRVPRRSRIVESCNSIVWSLNALAGHVSPHLHEPSFLYVNQAQSRSHAHIHQLHSEDRVVNDLSEEASLQAMLNGRWLFERSRRCGELHTAQFLYLMISVPPAESSPCCLMRFRHSWLIARIACF